MRRGFDSALSILQGLSLNFFSLSLPLHHYNRMQTRAAAAQQIRCGEGHIVQFGHIFMLVLTPCMFLDSLITHLNTSNMRYHVIYGNLFLWLF